MSADEIVLRTRSVLRSLQANQRLNSDAFMLLLDVEVAAALIEADLHSEVTSE